MSAWSSIKEKFWSFISKIFGDKKVKIGIYGPPNAGKTTLANKIIKDWTGEELNGVSEIPHETRRVLRKKDISIDVGKSSLKLDIVDTPGLATKLDYHDFLKYDLEEDEAKIRAKEAAEGVIEAIRWLDDLDGVLLVMDATESPYTQVNITVIGNMEARKLPLLIVANKIDLPTAKPLKIMEAFPQHTVIPISALKGENIETLYKSIYDHFR
ncbi:MAG TPA: GTP-binding protein [Halobacteria archaeon]|jgi:hypothetical protein|nr:GTP-binding protein [Halobacteria archaeon]HIH77901.1 GTP-binding protein [Halobacteria archaeon]